MQFQSLNLPEDLKRALAEAGYIDAMPVQGKVIELGLDGRDLYVQSQTGTGKTAAFLIVIFHRLLNDPSLKGRKALIMVPTRELAVQVEEEAKVLGRYLPFKVGSFYGGVGYGEQHHLLRNNVDILVGTPGRVLDLNSGGEMNLADVAFLVLDEADRMFDMGFYPDLRKLLKVVPPADRRQTMLFSATLNVYVKNLALEYTKEPVEIEIEPEHITVEEIEQILYHVPSDRKFELLLGIMRREQPESAIIFCNTKRYVEVVAQRLRRNGIRCEYISGDLPQKKRLSLIEDLKAGKYNYLVATDVAARGLDIEALSLVVNYDLPTEAENYVHRIGRTARAGKNGKAISFASEQDVYDLTGIERYISAKIPSEVPGEDFYAVEEKRRRFEDGDNRRDRDSRRDEGRRSNRQRGQQNWRAPASSPPQQQGDASLKSTARKTRPQPPPRPNLSEMTLEERKAYYNAKIDNIEEQKWYTRNYTSEGLLRNPARRAKGKGSKGDRAAQKRRKRERDRLAAQGITPESRQEGGKKPANFTAKNSQPKSAAAQKPAAVKQGLFGRIAALFKKK